MLRKILISSVLTVMALSASGQGYNLSENERRYIVTTKQPEPVKAVSQELDAELMEQDEPVDSMRIWFQHVSMCDWVPGMRFMVVPEKKDLIIKTFADASTGIMVSSASLRHKVMVYNGHDNANGGLHEHVNFTCEETGQRYYFEVPTSRFDDYCYTKAGVPTLVYLGDVDIAQEKLLGKTLITKVGEYFIDTPLSGDGYRMVSVPVGTEVKVVAVGAGTRSFPVKIVVKEVTDDGKGREFFQNVAISRTNSGLRDDEYEISNMIYHTFDGSFELADDNMSVGGVYEKYAHKEVYTLIPSDFVDAGTKSKVRLGRLTAFTVKSIRSQSGSEYAKMTLKELSTGKIYTKDVLFANKNMIGLTDRQHDDYVGNIFSFGNPETMEGVRSSTLQDLRNSVVRSGFSEEETRLALGEPTRTGHSGSGYTWVYNYPGKPRTTVHFNRKTNKVVRVDR